MDGTSGTMLEVVEADALAYQVDALVLKHADVPRGVDRATGKLLGLDLEGELPAGNHVIVPGRPAVGAEDVLFISVGPLLTFGYREIGTFAEEALEILARERADVKTVALTLHGAGYGLDELACLDSEVRGLIDAIEDGKAPGSLEQVLILESDPGRAERLRLRLRETLPASNHGSSAFRIEAEDPAAGEVLQQSVAAAPEQQDHAFIAMPFAAEFDDVFHYGIAAAVRNSGLLCERIDRGIFTGDILDRVKDKISTATLLVADLTDANPNVYLEVGYAWAKGVPAVLIKKSDSELMFDVRGERCLDYRSIKELEDSLTAELRQLVE
ncbi:MAG TPA: hypothetical protein VMS11_05080 [Solirubrobacterales bacterium]|nr:hypothetical protein [Solirubrobacterales bacterium]